MDSVGKMARVKDGAVARLHYALTESQCSNCGEQLEWNAVFDNISLPKYIAKHCGKIYTISVETAKFNVHEEKDAKREEKNIFGAKTPDSYFSQLSIVYITYPLSL